MTKVIHHGVINKKDIEVSIKKYGFKILDYNENNEYLKTIIEKDYAKSFNIDFNGMIKVECIIMRKMYDMFCVYTYPKFKEISNIIPKKAFYHMYEDGSICYAPPKRPLVEKWSLEDFISFIDSFFRTFCVPFPYFLNINISNYSYFTIFYHVYRYLQEGFDVPV